MLWVSAGVPLLADGKLRFISLNLDHVVVNIKKMRMTNKTSMKGIKLMSGSKVVFFLNFKFALFGVPMIELISHRGKVPGKTLRGPFHLQNEPVDLGFEKPPGHQTRYSDHQPHGRVVERH